MIPQVIFFSFCFWKNWGHHNLLSRFTDLYHYWRIYFTCSIFLPLCPSQLLSLVKTFYCCIYSWIYQSKKNPNHSPIFSSLRLTLECCHPQVHSLLHSLRQLLLISEALHCKRQIIPLRNPAKPVLFAVPGSQTPPAPRPRLKGPWLMCINEVNLLATR